MNTYTNTYLVSTQTLENYGAHDKDGRFSSGNAHWKFKGGNDYIITGVKNIQDAVAFVAAKCSNNIGFKEFPVQWEEVSADYQTTSEKQQLEYDGRIAYPADRINVQEALNAKREALYAESAGCAEVISEAGFETAKAKILKAIDKHDAEMVAERGTPERLDREHGSPWDRGHSDAYYGRSKNPHFYVGASYVGDEITRLTSKEAMAYNEGFDGCDEFKDWGYSNEDWAELAH
jgi:hypothetical protein